LSAATRWAQSALELTRTSDLPAFVKKHWKQELEHRLARLKTKTTKK
jgi:hypothetical protein